MPMFTDNLIEHLANERPALFHDRGVNLAIAGLAGGIPQLLGLARVDSESPPAYFDALDQMCEPIVRHFGLNAVAQDFGVSTNDARTELKNLLNFACWDVLDIDCDCL